MIASDVDDRIYAKNRPSADSLPDYFFSSNRGIGMEKVRPGVADYVDDTSGRIEGYSARRANADIASNRWRAN